MTLIKKYYNEKDFVQFEVPCIGTYMLDNVAEFKRGYRLYDGQVAQCNDITEEATDLVSADELIMLRPAHGPVGIIVGAIVAAVVVAAVAVKLLTPKIEAPVNSNRNQSSATNSLGGRENMARVGQRVDDVYGKVSRFVPALIQVPHFRFDDNNESEHFAMACRGRGLIENVVDGETDFSRLTGGKFNAWNPGGNPNDGSSPDFTIGGLVSRPLIDVRQSQELQAAELLPPNDLEISGDPIWFASVVVNSLIMSLSNAGDLGVDVRDYFTIGQDASLIDCTAILSTITNTYYRSGGNQKDFEVITGTQNISGLYEITDVGADFVTLDVSGAGFPQFFQSSLLGKFWGYSTQSVPGATQNTTDSEIADFTWYTDSGLTDQIINVQAFQNFPSVGQVVSGLIGPYFVPESVTTMSFNFVADAGFYKLDGNNEVSIDANIEIIYQYLDQNGGIGMTVFDNVPFSTNSDSKTKQAAITYDSPRSTGQYGVLVSCRRTTDRDKSDNITNIDKVNWRDFYFYTDVNQPANNEFTIMQVVIPSSIVARGVKERRIALDWTRYIEPYIGNGQFGSLTPIDTWAETLIALALDPLNGRLTIDEVDGDLLLDVQQQLINYYGSADYVKVGYDLDSTSLRFQDVYSLFCNALNVRAYSQGAVYRAYPDIKRDNSSKQFTHRNKVIGTDTKERIYNVENDGIELKYRSNETGRFETIIEHVNGVDSNNRLEIELSGATETIQAQTRAKRELNILKYQKYNLSFEADGIARLTVPGERVDNVDNTRIVKRENNTNIYQIYDGLVVSQNGLEIELSQPVTFTDGELHTIRFTNSKGELLESIECTEGSTAYHVILSQAPSETIYTGYKREKTNFTFCADNLRSSMTSLVRGLKAKETKGLRTRQVSAINWDERYYQNDQDF